MSFSRNLLEPKWEVREDITTTPNMEKVEDEKEWFCAPCSPDQRVAIAGAVLDVAHQTHSSREDFVKDFLRKLDSLAKQGYIAPLSKQYRGMLLDKRRNLRFTFNLIPVEYLQAYGL